MKYDLLIRYAGQKVVFKDLEYDDEGLVDESYLPQLVQCIDENNIRMVKNFFENVEIEIRRQE